MLNARFAMAFFHPISVVLGFTLKGGWLLSTILLSVIIYSLIEIYWARKIKKNVLAFRESENNEWLGEFVAYVASVSHLILVMWFVGWGSAHVHGIYFAAVCYSIGLCSGINAITLSHEFMHRPGQKERALGWLLLYAANYPWFRLQHLRRHHLLVATKSDPSTARIGQNIYSFYRQSIANGFVEILKIEAVRAQKEGKPVWSPLHNAAAFTLYIMLGIYLSIWIAFGLHSLVAFVLQGLVGIFILETINYIQHYGLTRESVKGRIYEVHAWDADSITNYALFNLGLHSDHHCRPGKSFASLAVGKQSPKMPFGYFTMAFVALFPPVWRKMMDHRIPNSQAI